VSGSVLHTGDVAAALCVRAASTTAPVPEGGTLEARMLVQVVEVAQVQLHHPTAAVTAHPAAAACPSASAAACSAAAAPLPLGAALSLPTGSDASPTVVCGAAYDYLGRRILPSTLSDGWLRLTAWPADAAHVTPAAAQGWPDGSCFSVSAGTQLLPPHAGAHSLEEHPILVASCPAIAPPTAATFVSLAAEPLPRRASTPATTHRANASVPPLAPPPALPGGVASTVLVSTLSTMLLLLIPLGGLQLQRWRAVARSRRREAEEAARINPRRDHPNVRSRASEGGPLSPKHALEHGR
jgi:hypothetical protein